MSAETSEASKDKVEVDPENYIQVGVYIIIEKHNYQKLVKYHKADTIVTLGRDRVNLKGIEGYGYFSKFKMVPKGSKKAREFDLVWVDEAVELKDEIDIKASGEDNRNIVDDGMSQKLTADEIRDLASGANSASDIVETLISNSNTFQDKTEFSQEKYLKKKERKYTEYIQIVRPNLRLVADIMYKLDPGKIQDMQPQMLAQVLTYSNVQASGVHLLYDSGSNGLMAAALLNRIGAKTEGKLIHMHPGTFSQKQALVALNLPEEQYNRCLSVNIYTVLRQAYEGRDNQEASTSTTDTATESLKRKADDNDVEHKSKIAKTKENQDSSEVDLHNVQPTIQDSAVKATDQEKSLDTEENTTETVKDGEKSENTSQIITDQEKSLEPQESTTEAVKNGEKSENTSQRKNEPKKPKWHYDNIAAAKLLNQKVDSLVIVCTEDPLNIFNALLPFVNLSRPFVVYYPYIEPLQNMYMELSQNPRIILLTLTTYFLRHYQVLPERTHPEMTTTGNSGYLLRGHIVQ